MPDDRPFGGFDLSGPMPALAAQPGDGDLT